MTERSEGLFVDLVSKRSQCLLSMTAWPYVLHLQLRMFADRNFDDWLLRHCSYRSCLSYVRGIRFRATTFHIECRSVLPVHLFLGADRIPWHYHILYYADDNRKGHLLCQQLDLVDITEGNEGKMVETFRSVAKSGGLDQMYIWMY